MDAVVVLPTGVREDTVHTRLSALLVGGDAARAEELDTTMLGLGSQTERLGTGAELRAYADRHSPPDACVIVTPLSDGPVLPLVRMLRTRGWQKIVILSGKADARAVHGALLAGVRGIIVRNGATPAPRATVRPTGSVRLSDRELEVLRMVADGQTNRIVGEKLGLSALTVKSHLARIARKLGSGDRAQMVATAIRSGYIR